MHRTRVNAHGSSAFLGPALRFFATVTLAALAGAALASSGARATPEDASPYRNLGTFARALAHIEMSWVEETDQDGLVEGAIRGMVATLDPHSAFMDPTEYRILSSDTRGRFGGIGVEIEVVEGWLTIISVFEGGPASRAGLRPGDRFLSVEDRDARDMRISDAVRTMRGEPGSRVRVRIRRTSTPQPLDLTLTREIIRVEAVDSRVLSDGVAYVRIKSFQETTTRELRRALDRAVAERQGRGGVRGVLLDFRNNPGGLLDEAVLVSDEFLASGVIVSTRARGQRLLTEARAHRGGTRPDWPMVVLVNAYTASASEIVAGALRDHGRAVVVGSRTFGKGSVQNIIELPDGSALKLTVARYYTPSGRSIQAHGIEPDLAIAPEGNARPRVREESLEGHLPAGTAAVVIRPPLPPALRHLDSAPTEASPAFPDDREAAAAHHVLRLLIGP